MTIKEIARESGYGVGTVSRVLNHSKNVSEEARKAIMEVVERHHFQPNANAKHLKMQTQFGVAVIVKGTENMLLSAIVERMQTLIEKSGFASVIYYIDEDANEVKQAELIMRERKPYGFVFMGSNLRSYGEELKKIDVPCLVVTNSASFLNLDHISSIAVDDTAAAGCMIDYLYEMGHRKIGIIGGDPELSGPGSLRLAGCQTAFFRHQMDFEPAKMYAQAHYSLEGGYQATKLLLKQYPEMTAIFAMSDIMAIGAVHALYEEGRRVPQDISVAGYDGIELSKYVHPTLTTIRQNVERMADQGTEILLRAIREGSGAVHEIIPFELQKGSSVRRV